MIPKRLARKKIFSSSLLDLFLDKVEFSSGHIVEDYHFLEFKYDSVVVFATNELNEICLIKSPRYVTGKTEVELPAGFIEKNESPIEAGQREFLEETGYNVYELNQVYTFNPANSISNQKAYILTGKVKSKTTSITNDADEVTSVEWLPMSKIKNMILSNEIADAFSVIAILIYYLYQQK